MKAALQARYLWMLVSGDETCPLKPDVKKPDTATAAEWKAEKKEYLDWQQQDQTAIGLMKGAVESLQMLHICNCVTSKAMWDILKKVHVTSHQIVNIHYWFEDLYTRKYTDGTPMADHIAVMLDLKHKITAAGKKLLDSHIARALIISLLRTPLWDVIKVQCFALSKDKFTPQNVGSTLQAEANHMAREKGSGETALFHAETAENAEA
ncbi:hypothetical protein EW026_g4574 [Hermanssonia centrifuga]|uniref:Uncharacterized protein n=1 Tax=Hermanssonia centrifuga TaxID=98765 RepID=A0A4S4KHT6_9APHY|nr:hypothetical protein EW026_g4574 [Hermanssonia centrifuga]